MSHPVKDDRSTTQLNRAAKRSVEAAMARWSAERRRLQRPQSQRLRRLTKKQRKVKVLW